ncbi:MAG: hypothetical protein M0R66_03875 [Candidatus Omnitrophica bacterium]|nr:hypothetical protein [Candidatus Omnitrophota bacterium]
MPTKPVPKKPEAPSPAPVRKVEARPELPQIQSIFLKSEDPEVEKRFLEAGIITFSTSAARAVVDGTEALAGPVAVALMNAADAFAFFDDELDIDTFKIGAAFVARKKSVIILTRDPDADLGNGRKASESLVKGNEAVPGVYLLARLG